MKRKNESTVDGLVKSPSTGRGWVSPGLRWGWSRRGRDEFTSNGGGGVALPRRIKGREATFYEVVNFEAAIANWTARSITVPFCKDTAERRTQNP
ncbi:hypothetical protein ACFL9T_20515 [Thermodesulfobacteriota bacterium]